MAEEITRIRKGNDITMKVRLFDNGEAVSWDSASGIIARLRSVEQDTFTQPLDTEVDGSDPELLIVRWPASRQCYTGLYDLVVGMERNGAACTTDAHAFALVATSAEAGWTSPASSDGLNVDAEYIPLSLAVSSGAGTGGDFLTRTEAAETYQTITDKALETEDKTVPGAINEVLSIAKDAQPKETGKGLSTNDYTNEDKQKVGNALLKTYQTLTPEEQKQARNNLGAQSENDNTLATVDKTVVGAINELNKNKADNNNVPTKLSQLENDAGFIKNTVSNLVNYYLKSDTYTKSEVNALIGKIIPFTIKKVSELPETGEDNIIYLVPSAKAEEENLYDEYLWLDGKWEPIGTTRIDLSNYYTIEQVNEKFVEKIAGKSLSTNDYTDSDKEKVEKAQPKTDNNLKTTDKTITGAVNEVYSTIGNIDTILDNINGEII